MMISKQQDSFELILSLQTMNVHHVPAVVLIQSILVVSAVVVDGTSARMIILK